MQKFFKQLKSKKAGFALLFTVIIISVILALGLGIADTTYKQSLLSSLSRESQLAFYQAESGVECGLYYDLHDGQFPRGTVTTKVPETLTCGNNTLSYAATQSYTDYFVYVESFTDNTPCFSITFDKTNANGSDSVSSRGYSTCTSTPQQVERALNVTY